MNLCRDPSKTQLTCMQGPATMGIKVPKPPYLYKKFKKELVTDNNHQPTSKPSLDVNQERQSFLHSHISKDRNNRIC